MKDNTSKGEKFTQVTESIIIDEFYCDGNKIGVLDNKAFKGVAEDDLLLAKLIETKQETLIEALTEEEYAKAVRKYEALIDMMEEAEYEQEKR